jgi:hypothetical protein
MLLDPTLHIIRNENEVQYSGTSDFFKGLGNRNESLFMHRVTA